MIPLLILSIFFNRLRMSNKGKHVVVSSETYDYLVEQGRKNESFDDVLKRLLNVDK